MGLEDQKSSPLQEVNRCALPASAVLVEDISNHSLSLGGYQQSQIPSMLLVVLLIQASSNLFCSKCTRLLKIYCLSKLSWPFWTEISQGALT